MSVPSMVHRSVFKNCNSKKDKIVRTASVEEENPRPRRSWHPNNDNNNVAGGDDDTAVCFNIQQEKDIAAERVEKPSASSHAPASGISTETQERTETNPDGKELPDCKVRRNYTCPKNCGFFTQNPRQFLYHLRDVHLDKIRVYECPDCIYASKHYQKLWRHRRMVHATPNNNKESTDPANASQRPKRKRSISSTIKNNTNPKPNAMTTHQVSMETNNNTEGCSIEMSNEEQETTDRDSQTDETMEQSSVLNGSPNNLVTTNSSARIVEELFSCSVCDYTARGPALLSRHEREEHIKTKFFRCAKCTYVTHIKARYTKHVKYHSMPMIKCDQCDFRTPYKWNLDRHCKNHNGKGLFKCSACNFTADIKQSLTVHEMNHHTPPVGQAAGLGISKRRTNKVGASDTTFTESVADEGANSNGCVEGYDVDGDREKQARPSPLTNGNFIKSCNKCHFKTYSDAEMAKHEINSHSINNLIQTVKKKRPIPNLIPIPTASLLKTTLEATNLKLSNTVDTTEAMMSQADISDICSKSANSSLKDFASLFSSEDVFRNSTPKVPDLIPTTAFSSNAEFKQKNASFFDKLKEKLEIGTGGSNLVCKTCGYESKCLTEHAKHQKACGKEINRVPNIMKMHNISASRCQYCRQRCKSSVDLFNHLQTCAEAIRQHNEELLKQEQEDLDENELQIDEDRCNDEDECDVKPHPMENKVFVWNDIMVPMDIEVDDSNYEYTEDRAEEEIESLDLSIRTQSPTNSESNTIISQESNNNIYDKSSNPSPLPTQNHSEKVPTHGNDISVAQHKRVFKCPHCTFWASTASRFHVHIVGHLNKKPFECSLCSYKSNWRWDITKHIKLKSVRDHAHESAKVLMTDETGRRNYTKYNKYLTEIPLSSLQSTSETSGGAGTRPRNSEKSLSSGKLADDVKLPGVPDITPVRSRGGKSQDNRRRSNQTDNKRTLFKCKRCNHRDASKENLLLHVKEHYKQQSEESTQALSYHRAPDHFYPNSEPDLPDVMSPLPLVAGTSRTSVNASALVGGMASLMQQPMRSGNVSPVAPLSLVKDSGDGALNYSTQDLSLRGTSPDRDEASVNNNQATGKGGALPQIAPFRCGHCNQVSNWKHVIQRHCRLKHSGDIRVISNKNGQEKIEVEEPTEDTDTEGFQSGAYRCSICPFSSDSEEDFENHMSKHLVEPHLIQSENAFKCSFCKYYTLEKEDLLEHLKLHGVIDPNTFLETTMNQNEADAKKFRCPTCPYITNSKSQYSYHKTFHKARGGEFSCSYCSYNVSKRHLLHQHLKVHGINVTSYSKPNDNELSVEDDKDIPLNLSSQENSQFDDIPLVWASKNGKFQKMYKCRFCPHVNVRKINIHDHEKMHGTREKNQNGTAKQNDIEHRCTECSYICNNAGVLSSHTKVHQGLYATVHCLVDPTKTDEEQLQDLHTNISKDFKHEVDFLDNNDADEFLDTSMLYFCKECPGRFLNEQEFTIHKSFHSSDMPYQCNVCSYATPNDSYLMLHVRVHAKEYQERTQILKNLYNVSPKHPPPSLHPKQISNGDIIYDVNSSKVKEISDLAHIYKKPSKFNQNVPISGTDLFQQKSEAQLQQNSQNKPAEPKPDPISQEEYAILMQGSPEFTYPTVLKNGRVKEKRYKCHKCPSAFEKREQYKIHLGLHGANQRYSCEICDYSVKYYANFVQHKKKHKFSDDAQLAKQALKYDNNINYDDSIEQVDEDDVDMKLNVADQQIVNILQDRQTKEPREPEEKKLHWCQKCPYVSTRRDAVESHQKRHASISGLTSSYACDHCDYSVPQAHYLRDHTKLHFIPNKVIQPEGFMLCDKIKLTSNEKEASKVKEEDDEMVFEEHELEIEDSKFSPSLDEEVANKFNNNKGEKQLINVQNNNLVVKTENSDKAANVDNNNSQMEVN